MSSIHKAFHATEFYMFVFTNRTGIRHFTFFLPSLVEADMRGGGEVATRTVSDGQEKFTSRTSSPFNLR